MPPRFPRGRRTYGSCRPFRRLRGRIRGVDPRVARPSRSALNLLGAGAAAVETLIGASLELSSREALVPLKQDWTGQVVRAGGVLSGPVPLALRLIAGRSPSARKAAALSTIVGSFLTRVGWLAAGRASAARS